MNAPEMSHEPQSAEPRPDITAVVDDFLERNSVTEETYRFLETGLLVDFALDSIRTRLYERRTTAAQESTETERAS